MTYISSPIQHKAISSEIMAVYSERMIRGNTILKSYCDRFRTAVNILEQANYGGPIDELRERLLHPIKHRFYLAPASVGLTGIHIQQIEILRNVTLKPNVVGRKNLAYNRLRVHYEVLLPLMTESERQEVLFVSSKADEICAGFINLVGEFVKRFRYRCNSVIDEDDLFQSGILAIYDAIYGYTNTEYKFITLAGISIKRRITRTLAAGNDFANISEGCDKLIAAYYAAVIKCQEDFSFDDIFQQMKIKMKNDQGEIIYRPPTTKEIEKLKRIFSRFLRGSDLSDDEEQTSSLESVADHIDQGIDFETMNYSEIISKLTFNAEDRKILEEASLKKTNEELARRAKKIRRTKLSDEELELLQMAQRGKRGFKTKWAAKHNFSKQWATLALKAATKKIASIRDSIDIQQQGSQS